MTTLIRLLFPHFDPAPTVENFGARIEAGEAVGDDREREEHLNEVLDQSAASV
jgi:hypothetical protein